MISNADLRLKIVEMVKRSGEGHIPSSFSIVDILNVLYGSVLRYDIKNPNWENRDYFVLSKGHGCGALYAVMNKYGLLPDSDLNEYGTKNGRLGGHPDLVSTHFIEASTGSLGHGFLTAIGVALGLKLKKSGNRVFTLIGDGECHEGTIWEGANIATNKELDNICAIVDLNQSSIQLMPKENMREKWQAFGWRVLEVDGHNEKEILSAISSISFGQGGQPTAILAKTVKGKGVSFIEGHGKWHHRVPDEDEMKSIIEELGA